VFITTFVLHNNNQDIYIFCMDLHVIYFTSVQNKNLDCFNGYVFHAPRLFIVTEHSFLKFIWSRTSLDTGFFICSANRCMCISKMIQNVPQWKGLHLGGLDISKEHRQIQSFSLDLNQLPLTLQLCTLPNELSPQPISACFVSFFRINWQIEEQQTTF